MENAQITAQATQLLGQGFTYRQLEDQLGVPKSKLHRLVKKAEEDRVEANSIPQPGPLLPDLDLPQPKPNPSRPPLASAYATHRRAAARAEQQHKQRQEIAHQQKVNQHTSAGLDKQQERLNQQGLQNRREQAILQAGQKQLGKDRKQQLEEQKKPTNSTGKPSS